MIIGICGKKRHGKNTVANIIKQNYGSYTIAFADPIKRACMDWWQLSYEQMYGDDLKEVVDERWGKSPRQFMQLLGAEVARNIHPETWAKLCLQNIKDADAGRMPWVHDEDARSFLPAPTDVKIWCISDVRYPNEAALIRQHGGKILKVVRPSIVNDDTHSSEIHIDDIEGDVTILNDTYAQLEQDVLAWMQTL